MNLTPLYRKIVTSLFVAAVLLLICNIAADKLFPGVNSTPAELNGEQINREFILALKNFGIDTSWIKVKKPSRDDPDSLFASYLIDVPKDLPITLLLKEIYNSYDTNNVNVKAQEKKTAGKTVLNISSGSEVKLISEFNYKEGINRKAGAIAFLLEDFNDLDDREDSVLLNSPEAFAVIITPSKAAAELGVRVHNLRKEFIVELNDQIDELDYKLSSTYSEQRLKLSIRSILGAFSKAIFIMIDDDSNLYSSSAFRLVQSELEKRNIKLVKKSLFKRFDEENLQDNLRRYLYDMEDKQSMAVIISAEDYLNVNNLISSFRKIGYKFINPSLAIL